MDDFIDLMEKVIFMVIFVALCHLAIYAIDKQAEINSNTYYDAELERMVYSDQ